MQPVLLTPAQAHELLDGAVAMLRKADELGLQGDRFALHWLEAGVDAFYAAKAHGADPGHEMRVDGLPAGWFVLRTRNRVVGDLGLPFLAFEYGAIAERRHHHVVAVRRAQWAAETS